MHLANGARRGCIEGRGRTSGHAQGQERGPHPTPRGAGGLIGQPVPKDDGGRTEAAKELAARTGWTVLLKGRVDASRTGGESSSTGPAMRAVWRGAARGDVLAGITAGLLSKGMAPFNAARAAAYLNGSAGDMAFEEYSYGLMATDLLERVPQVLQRCLSML